ncbi:hypothetical protein [Couchioplanes caeruleus]|uniref:Uncharacterized protein n=1 Tax=Couchioplanes caeruleus TaxID=56438 RepID=A0A3N1GTA9_9ACTN|nr:hypothetical protein [Couchioplanes caeruleus]ROP33477.1 hypothetical protein EDD30_6463 [Couchioplanes caeruleus]
MPWAALLSYTIVAALLTTVVAILQIVVPQDSHDKVLWWNTLLRWRRNRTEKPTELGVEGRCRQHLRRRRHR